VDGLTFAAIADDDTGASDLAGMLAEQDLSTLLVIDLPEVECLLEWSRNCHAVVMAEGTRSIEPSLAYQRTRDAIRLLAPLRPRVFEIKYCSTFDSTAAGNIGPTIDAAMDELAEEFTIALPALPVNGRTTYMGYHFVHRLLLSDSPMRSHPLTPMTNPNLVDFLGRQTHRKVGLAPYPVVEAGAEAIEDHFGQLRQDGVAVAIADCLHDRHLKSICEAAAGLRLITGSSAPAMKLPAIWRRRGWIAPERAGAAAVGSVPAATGCLLVAGSCSVATRGQNAWLATRGARVVQLAPRELAAGNFNRSAIVDEVGTELRAGRNCLVATSAAPEEVQSAQQWGSDQGLSPEALGLRLVRALADLTLAILEEHPSGGLIVAGGETAGAICRRLELGAFRVGKNIDPGVPLCFSLGRFRMRVVLKSGNFGSPDFYGKAIRAIKEAQ
jgi:uncharacterized protein YgbK (DUF1537 family)